MSANCPIWKDSYAQTWPGPFEIHEYGSWKLVMSGVAVAKPGETRAKINVSRLVEDDIFHSAPSFTPGVTVTHDDAVKDFSLMGEDVTNYVWDWSYQDRVINDNTVFNFPIKDKYGVNQLRFTTSMESAETSVAILRTTTQSAGGNECGEYALYYLNRYGGWDSFLFEGRCKRKDEISALTLTQEYDNNNPYAIGLTNYYSTITPKWELNTGWLTDNQSESFAFNVIPSPMVYLHNLVDNTIFPVVITNNEAEYKQKTRQNRHINYILNVTASQNQHINQ